MEVKRSGMIHYVLVINMKDLKLLQITNWAHTHACMQALYNYATDVCLSLSAWGQNNHRREVGPIQNVSDELRWGVCVWRHLETLGGCQGSSGIPTAPRLLPRVSCVFSALLSHVCLLCLSVCVQSSGMLCSPALHHAIKSQKLQNCFPF